MITDLILALRKVDPLMKRNLIKTASYRLLGSIDTVILGWLITGNFTFGAKIGASELLTKMLLYYGHERVWQNIKFGLPSRKAKSAIVQNENKAVLFKHAGKITRNNREQLNGNRAFTLWFTGLSASGKSTLATELESWLFEQQARVYILDGDNTRLGINSDLSFSDEDRSENIRRVAEICKLFNDAGTIVIAAFISPFKNDRQLAQTVIGKESFIQAHVDASVAICSERDKKGLYKLAAEGKLKNFTGISGPYEAPIKPDIHLSTDDHSIDECLAEIKSYLVEHGYVSKNTPANLEPVIA